MSHEAMRVNVPVPTEIRTERLLLRSWRAEDAALLHPILDANVEHLRDWIPAHVFTPVPLPELERRLSGFASDFQRARAWRYVLFSKHDRTLVGEVSLFPRSAGGRVAIVDADRVEIGYWLRRDATGHGYASEASSAMLALAEKLPGIHSVEIRCDPRNAPSAAVPKRLGFTLITSDEGAAADGVEARMVWTFPLGPPVQR